MTSLVHHSEFLGREVEIELPTLHIGQEQAYDSLTRFTAIRCGRRWGKTTFGEVIAADDAMRGWPVGWFAPEYTFAAEAYANLERYLFPLKTGGRQGKKLELAGGGSIEFWTLDNENAGRSRKYKRAIMDEVAFTKSNMIDIWNRAIRPTLVDFRGSAIAISNTKGIDETNFMWQICHQTEHGFTQFHAPTHANPFLPPEEIALLQKNNHPLVYAQEYLAEFVDWSGVAFLATDKLLINGHPVPMPKRCDGVFAVIDTATKTGSKNDGTAVVYCAVMKFGFEYKLVVLDWDVTQIEGSLLHAWLPNVFRRLEALAAECGARKGSLGTFIEDKAAGEILNQQARRNEWPSTPIDSRLTALGKDERSISISGYHFQGLIKIAEPAFHKTMLYKGITRNHLLGQIGGFRVGDKDAGRREDDILDAYCYAVAIALGDSGGF